MNFAKASDFVQSQRSEAQRRMRKVARLAQSNEVRRSGSQNSFKMTIGEKVSYLKGLAEGLNTEDKIVNGILDVLADIAENLAEVDEELDDVASVMTDMEESLADIEDDLYGDDDEDYYEDIDDEIGDMYETVCPNCGNAIRFDYEQANAGGMDCPNCGKRLEFVVDEDDDSEEL